MGNSLVKPVFSLYCVIKRIVNRAPKRLLYPRTHLRVWIPKGRKLISRETNSFI